MDYYEFCENLYQNWLNNDHYFDDFRRKFDVDYLPEPYYLGGPGNDKFLFILNNNPGGVMSMQARAEFVGKNYKHYCDAANAMANVYLNDPNFVGPARTRLLHMRRFAERLSLDGFINVETFFLHSSRFDKRYFLEHYVNNQIVKEYTDNLKSLLKNKPVLYISGFNPGRGSKDGISLECLKKDKWIKHQADVIGMDLNKVQMIVTRQKEKRVTACIIVDGNKMMSFCWGTNNLPNISDDNFEAIRRTMNL